jgi:rubrerythrin
MNTKEYFAERRKWQKLLRVLLGILIVAFVLTRTVVESSSMMPYRDIFSLVTVAAILGYAFYTRKYWTCPVCHQFLGGGLDIVRCPKCGAELA